MPNRTGRQDGTEICGDVTLTASQRARYIDLGFAEIRRSLFASQVSKRSLPWSVHSDHSRSLRSGSSPLRVYTNDVLAQMIKRYCPSPGVILDVGCGRGEYAEMFSAEEISGSYIGLDVRPHSIWAEQQRRQRGLLKCLFLVSPAEKLPLSESKVDFVVSSSALEHIEDDEQAVAELRAAMIPGGHGIHIVPSAWSLFLYGYHGWRKYSATRLRSLFESAGFTVVEVFPLGGLPTFLVHLLWISTLESGITTKLVFDCLTRGGRPQSVRNLFPALKISSLRKRPLFLRAYARLAGTALRFDRLFPWPAHGYAALVRLDHPS